ncbi:MAG: hypothetical protein JW876_11645 [Candidatus Krumholzibacteriota bacterium]|nr:hypothetical protein [Candidatus Krumholzibacteriota bacterium]
MGVARSLARHAPAVALVCLFAGCESIGETIGITGFPEWEPVGGPPGGTIVDVLEAAPGVLVASSADRGLFRSTDGGASWVPVLSFPPETCVRMFASPHPDTVLAIVNDRRILRSTDGGATWPVVASEIGGVELLAGPGRVYCRTFDGILRSTDAGESWTTVLSIEASRLHAVTSAGHVYVSTSRELHRSTNGGDSWSRIDNGAIGDLITAAAVLPGVGIFVGTSMRSVFLSPDDGATWRAVGAHAFGDDALVWRISTVGKEAWVDADDRGIFATGDGETWRRTNLPVFSLWCIRAVSGSGAIVGTRSAGAWTTTDGGDSWSPLPLDIGIAEPHDILPVAGGGILVATSCAGLWYSPPGTGSWRPANGGIREPAAYFLRHGPGGDLWAITTGGLHRSADLGVSWECASRESLLGFCRGFDVGPDGRLWLASCSVNLKERGIFVSSDGGASWIRSFDSAPDLECVRCLLAAPDGRIAAAADGLGVLVLEEGADAWAGAGLAGESVRALAAAGGGRLVAGGHRDVWLFDAIVGGWRSLGLDAGATRLFSLVGGILALTWETERLVFMPTGGDWFPFDDGMDGRRIRDVEIDAGGLGWAATGDGVWRTTEPCSWLE